VYFEPQNAYGGQKLSGLMSKLPDVVDNGIPMTLGGLQGHSAIASFFKSDFSHSLPSVRPGADPGHVQAVR